MGLDRKLQCQILEYLQPFYGRSSSDIEKQAFTQHPDYTVNLKYLYDSKFITGNNIRQLGTTNLDLHNISIAKAGMDFLEITNKQSTERTHESPLSISNSTVIIGNDNKVHNQPIESKYTNTANTPPIHATPIIRSILIGIIATVVGGLILWYLTH